MRFLDNAEHFTYRRDGCVRLIGVAMLRDGAFEGFQKVYAACEAKLRSALSRADTLFGENLSPDALDIAARLSDCQISLEGLLQSVIWLCKQANQWIFLLQQKTQLMFWLKCIALNTFLSPLSGTRVLLAVRFTSSQ